jgi:hypothetical protein
VPPHQPTTAIGVRAKGKEPVHAISRLAILRPERRIRKTYRGWHVWETNGGSQTNETHKHDVSLSLAAPEFGPRKLYANRQVQAGMTRKFLPSSGSPPTDPNRPSGKVGAHENRRRFSSPPDRDSLRVRCYRGLRFADSDHEGDSNSRTIAPSSAVRKPPRSV